MKTTNPKLLNIILAASKYFGVVVGTIFSIIPHKRKKTLAGAVGFIVSRIPSKVYIFFYPFLYSLLKRATRHSLPIIINKEVASSVRMLLDICQKTQRQIFLGRPYESNVRKYVEANIKPGDIFFDIGANVGYYSLIVSPLVGEKGKVYAFEPERINQKSLEENVINNGFLNITLVKAAVGEKTGSAFLHINPLNEGGHSLNFQSQYHDSGELWSKEKVQAVFPNIALEQPTSVVSIDSFMKNDQNLQFINLAKIDVEGYEEGVINGMTNALKNGLIEKLVCEISSNNSPVIKKLNSLGYFVKKLDRKGRAIPVKGDSLFADNYVFERKA